MPPKCHKAVQVAARSPLPRRETPIKNPNPGAPDLPRSHRSSAEVAAANARKDQKHQQIDALKKKKLAELEIEEKDADDEEEMSTINHVGDLERMLTENFGQIEAYTDGEMGDIYDNFRISEERDTVI